MGYRKMVFHTALCMIHPFGLTDSGQREVIEKEGEKWEEEGHDYYMTRQEQFCDIN